MPREKKSGFEVWAIVVAAGRGERFGAGTPKQFVRVERKTVLQHALHALWDAFPFAGMVVAVPPGREKKRELLDRFERDDRVRLVAGGKSRTASVRAALRAVPARAEIVLVHDAARPRVSGRLVAAVVEGARRHGACVPVLRPADTVKELDGKGRVRRTLDRSALGLVQTPQGFRREVLLRAFRRCGRREFTDDAALVEAAGGDVFSVPGDTENSKITTAADLERLFPRAELRIGHGYDAHRLAEGRKLVLGGVEIESPVGPLAHSDGDVALHALMDALVGATAFGDIGRHFPSSDERLRGISSLVLLDRTKKILHEAGFAPHSVDITIVLERPRLSPFVDRMREKISAALGISLSQVSVKATTEEGLGFTGTGQGVAAHAVALVVGEQ